MTAHVEESRGQAERRMRELAAGLAALRHHPCLLFVSSTIQGQDLVNLRKALSERQGDHLDAIVASPGGDVGAAYLIARELRRRFARLTVYVPLQAKSAAILLCLAAEELVLGALGELGPLDQQYDAKQQADFPSAPPGSSPSGPWSSSSGWQPTPTMSWSAGS
jgi:ClpP class serine protease